jgi:hypothetical protein
MLPADRRAKNLRINVLSPAPGTTRPPDRLGRPFSSNVKAVIGG